MRGTVGIVLQTHSNVHFPNILLPLYLVFPWHVRPLSDQMKATITVQEEHPTILPNQFPKLEPVELQATSTTTGAAECSGTPPGHPAPRPLGA